MTTGHIPVLEHPAQALGWLELLAPLMPPTVTIEVSSWLVLAVLVAMGLWPQPARPYAASTNSGAAPVPWASSINRRASRTSAGRSGPLSRAKATSAASSSL